METLRRNASFIVALLVIIGLALVAGAYTPQLTDLLPRPAATRAPAVWIEQIRPIAELATVEYRTVAAVENENIPEDFRQRLGMRERIVMLVYGDVKAGFDLNKISDDSLWTDGDRVQLTLPRPEILSLTIDNERTHVVAYERSLFVGRDIQLEGEARAIADRAIREEAERAGALDLAGEYGTLYFENYLRSLGFTEVRVVIR